MNIRLSNQLNMVGACLNVAQNEDHALVWTDHEPTAFATELATLRTSYTAVEDKAVLAESAGGGAADMKALAETVLEDSAYVLARALAAYFKKIGDLSRRAQVDVSHSEIKQLREADLVSKTAAIRDLALAAKGDKEAIARGVTAARIEALSSAISVFKAAMATPRGQIVNRSTLLKEIETDTAALLEQLRDLDDLVLQFDGSAAGDRFIAAWKRARTIIDRVGEIPAKAPVAPVPAMAN